MFFAVTSYITGIASLAIASFVYYRKPESLLTKLFCFLTVSVAVYSIFIATAVLSKTPAEAIFWLRIEHVGNAFIPTAYLHFSLAVIKQTRKWRPALIIAYLISFLLVPTVFTDLWIGGVRKDFAGLNFYPSPGPLYALYFLMYCAVFAFAQTVVFLASRRLKGHMSKQALFVFWSGFLGSLAGSVTFLPLYGIEIAPNLNSLAILYLMALAYAILKHGLMDITVLVKKTLVFAGIVTTAVCAIALPLAVIQTIIGTAVGTHPFLLMVVGIITAVLIYRPVDRVLTNVTDRFLFQKKINYRLLLKEATEYLAYLDSLKRQARRIVAFVLVKARIANAAVYAFDSRDPSSLELKASRPFIKDPERRSIHLSHPAAHYMQTHKGSLERHALRELKRSEKDTSKLEEFDEMIQLLEDQNAEAAIPCFSGDATLRATHGKLYLRGILFLGHQKSDEPYTEEDLDVFFTLGQESSIAFENARLYDEAIERAKELQRINIELNDAQRDLMTALESAEDSRKQALLAKEKTEEMELELIRREKLVFVEQLVKGIAHEIFNPLTPMVQYIDRLDDVLSELHMFYDEVKYSLQEEKQLHVIEQFRRYREAIRVLNNLSEHLFLVVDTLTQMQKADDQSIKAFDFKSFWASASNMIKVQSHGEILEEVLVEEEIPRNLPPVKGNPVQLTQVFLNLYRNALYAMNGRPERKMAIKAWVDDRTPGYLSISFTDSGVGIPPDVLPKIFDYMFTTKGDKGQGIGLNMCRIILERFDGSITCESEPGKGTTFLIKLPIVEGKS